MSKKTKALCEGAVMVALALILGMLRIYRLPDGGSINLAILPLVFFAIRYGGGWGALAGVAFGILDYVVNFGVAIDWTSILFDYIVSYGLLGLGAGLFKNRKWSAYWGTLTGGILLFLSCYLVGVFVWGRYMPEVFMGMAMTSPWFYSFLYNMSWAGPDILLTIACFAILYRIKPVRRFLLRQDLADTSKTTSTN